MNTRWNVKLGLNYDILKYSKCYIDILKTAKTLILAKTFAIFHIYLYLENRNIYLFYRYRPDVDNTNKLTNNTMFWNKVLTVNQIRNINLIYKTEMWILHTDINLY